MSIHVRDREVADVAAGGAAKERAAGPAARDRAASVAARGGTTSPVPAASSYAAAAELAVTSVQATAARRRQRGVDVLFAGARPTAAAPGARPATPDASAAPDATGTLAAAPAAPTAPTVAGDPLRRHLVLSALQVAQDGHASTVTVTLRTAAGEVTGQAQTIASRNAVLRAVATAVLQAVERTSAGRVRGELVSVEVGPGVGAGIGASTPAVATTVVELVGPDGDARCVVGAAVVGDAPHQAVARATLDAVDRSVQRLVCG